MREERVRCCCCGVELDYPKGAPASFNVTLFLRSYTDAAGGTDTEDFGADLCHIDSIGFIRFYARKLNAFQKWDRRFLGQCLQEYVEKRKEALLKADR